MEKLHWLKLPSCFFNDRRIKVLRMRPNGDRLTIIFLKLQLISLNNDGFLEYMGLLGDIYEEIAIDIEEKKEEVAELFEFLLQTDLIEEVEKGSLYCILSEDKIIKMNKSSDRMRRKRERDKLAKEAEKMEGSEDVTVKASQCDKSVTSQCDGQSVTLASQCDKGVTSQCDGQSVTLASQCDKGVTSQCDVEKEREKEKEKEIEIDKEKSKPKEKRQSFSPPTLEQVKAYIQEKGYTTVNAERFIAYYESQGWLVGKNKMKNWKAAVAGWESRNKDNPKKEQPATARSYDFNKLAQKSRKDWSK